MALGELSRSTGLADAFGRSVNGWLPGGQLALIAAATLVAVITSEFTSNTASASMVVPAAMALATNSRDALVAALAATFAASLGFMMPVSTPCNAIVYGTGRIRLPDMIRSGVCLDVAGAVVITMAMLLVGWLWPR
jgi:sodium-dependent dicarboxylate transporter 2/3/5